MRLKQGRGVHRRRLDGATVLVHDAFARLFDTPASRATRLRSALDLEARARLAAEIGHQLDETLHAITWLVDRLSPDDLPDAHHPRIATIGQLLTRARELARLLQGNPQDRASASRSTRGSST